MPQEFFDEHEESLQQINSADHSGILPQKPLLLVDYARSNGPFLRLCDGQEVFDARMSGPPLIGYNASPLFGTIHFLDNWLGRRSSPKSESHSLQSSFQEFKRRRGEADFDTEQPAVTINRNYVSALILDQYEDQAQQIAESIQKETQRLQSRFPELISIQPTGDLSFSLRPLVQSIRQQLLETRLRYNLLFDIDGDELRFTLNLGYRSNHLQSLWKQLEFWLEGDRPLTISTDDTKVLGNYQFHLQLLAQKLIQSSTVSSINEMNAETYLSSELDRILPNTALEVQVVTQESYPKYRQQILEMQSEVYEPARQTPPEEFDSLFDPKQLQHPEETSVERPPLAVIVLEKEKIISMAFAGPLDMFTCERGVSTDPYLRHPMTYYMLDLTVIESYRGKLGRLMKNAITLLATQSNVNAIHGRNRDRLARGMWAINLSLGSYEIQHLPDDYPDNQAYRDCIYYRCPLNWDEPHPAKNWSRGYLDPLRSLKLSESFFQQNLTTLVNGNSGSRTLSLKLVNELTYFARRWPDELQHVLATCRPFDAGKHILDSINPTKASNLLDQGSTVITIEGCQLPFPEYCNVLTVANPLNAGKVQFLNQLRTALKDNLCSALVIEPIILNSHDRLSAELMAEAIQLGNAFQVPVVFVESASLLFRYGSQFAASCEENLRPDLVVANLGCSMSVILGKKRFRPESLVLGGEAIGLYGFNELIRTIGKDLDQYQESLTRFDQVIESFAERHSAQIQVKNAVGWIEGDLPSYLPQGMETIELGRCLFAPSLGHIQRLTKWIDDCE